MPGPICYGRGGSEVTVTDADLVLGVLNPDRPLAGGLKLDPEAARRGVAELGGRLGMSALECAAGVVEIIDSRMEDLIRRVTIQRGQDPRSFVIWAYGGASGAHAGLFGRGLGVEEVVFPLNDAASVWSAYGLTLLKHARTFQANALLRTPFDLDRLAELLAGLQVQALEYAAEEGIASPVLIRRADMKYSLQVFEVETDVPEGEVDDGWGEVLMANFQRTYEARYGRGSGYAEAGAVMTAVRVTVRESTKDTPLGSPAAGTGRIDPETSRDVYWTELGRLEKTPVYAGQGITPGAMITGPAIAEYPNTTIAVRPEQSLRADERGNLILRLKGER
jgi:N-methylhydantoinase A